jgi:hypothetical protein
MKYVSRTSIEVVENDAGIAANCNGLVLKNEGENAIQVRLANDTNPQNYFQLFAGQAVDYGYSPDELNLDEFEVEFGPGLGEKRLVVIRKFTTSA